MSKYSEVRNALVDLVGVANNAAANGSIHDLIRAGETPKQKKEREDEEEKAQKLLKGGWQLPKEKKNVPPGHTTP